MTTEVRQFADTYRNIDPYTSTLLGTVVSINTSPAYTLTVKLDGEDTGVSRVRYLSSCYPEPGSMVVLQRIGTDLVAVGSIAGKGGAVPAARVYKSSSQALTTTTATLVTFSTVQFDPWGMFDNANDQFVAPMAGAYLGTVTLAYTGVVDTNVQSTYLRTYTTGGTAIEFALERSHASITGNIWHNVAMIFQLGKGERMRVEAQSTVTTTTVATNNTDVAFSMSYLGPDS